MTMQNEKIIKKNRQYTIREYDPGDMDSVITLIRYMDDGQMSIWDESFWRWKHERNPFGSSIGFVAINQTGQIVGFQTFMRWRLKVGDTIIRAVRSVDTITHPEYRGCGISSALNHRAFEQMKAEGSELIFGTPNNQFLPSQMKWRFSYVSFCRPLLKVLHYPRFLAGLIRNRRKRGSLSQISLEKLFRYRLPSVAEFIGNSEKIDRLLHSSNQSRGGRLFTVRSLDYLRWRYAECPISNYVALYRKMDSGLSGCAILRPNSRFGLNEVVLSELLLSQPDEALTSFLLNEVKKSISADYIIGYFPSSCFERSMLQRHGFRQVPKNGVHFTIKVFNQNILRDPRDIRNWDLSLGDLEIF